MTTISPPPPFFSIRVLLLAIISSVLTLVAISFTILPQVQAQGVVGFYANLSGTEEVPPTESNATGYAVVLFNNESSQLSYLVNTTGLAKVTAAHTHNGTTGVNGDIVITLIEDISANDKKNPVMWFTEDITKDDLQGPLKNKDISDLVSLMNNESAYVNVHTEKYPDGAIRGQIFPGQVQMDGGVITGLQTGFGLIPLTGLLIGGGGISFLTSGGIVGVGDGGIVGVGDGGGFSDNTLNKIGNAIDKILSTGEDTVNGVTDTASGISDDLRNNLENIKDGLDKIVASDGGSNDGGSNDGGSNDGGSNDGGSNDGGSNDGGSNDGGSNDGGSNDGGSNDGGSNDGGSNDGDSVTDKVKDLIS